MKARPGAWSLRLRGRSAEIYDVATHDGMDPNFNEGMVLTLDSFSGKVAQIRVGEVCVVLVDVAVMLCLYAIMLGKKVSNCYFTA